MGLLKSVSHTQSGSMGCGTSRLEERRSHGGLLFLVREFGIVRCGTRRLEERRLRRQPITTATECIDALSYALTASLLFEAVAVPIPLLRLIAEFVPYFQDIVPIPHSHWADDLVRSDTSLSSLTASTVSWDSSSSTDHNSDVRERAVREDKERKRREREERRERREREERRLLRLRQQPIRTAMECIDALERLLEADAVPIHLLNLIAEFVPDIVPRHIVLIRRSHTSKIYRSRSRSVLRSNFL